ncbi:MAG: NAD(P)/FAD-dependent oxidoreductase [Solirubrobacteraceae bacterium]
MAIGAREARVVIVGAGFSGIGMAIGLRERGVEDFVVLERAGEVGGTWQYNTYPGCRCDVPSHLYSFSFAPNPEWSQTYSRQPEIREYVRRVVDEYGIRPHILTDTEVKGAAWSEDKQRWEIETSQGDFSAEILITGTGPLTEPKLPDVPGMETFRGEVMHSARWDHDYELAGKRVASIGTGASAIQYVPEIQKEVDKLYVFQRTAPWVLPHSNRPITDYERTVYRRFPRAQRFVRNAVYASRELLVLGFVKDPRLMRLLEKLGRAHREKQISDPELRAKVTPKFSLGCKRILPSNDWYQALQEPNVELVTGALAGVRENSVVDEHGTERDVDAIILGTGFHVADPPVGEFVRGRDGRLMSEVWNGRPQAYFGASVPGFPNFFLLLGPNTGLGHSSMIYMIESQIEHVLAAVTTMDRLGARTIEVRPEAYEAFNRDLDERLAGTVWQEACSTWYFDVSGRNAALWPDWTWRFRRRAARFDHAAYALAADKPTPVAA